MRANHAPPAPLAWRSGGRAFSARCLAQCRCAHVAEIEKIQLLRAQTSAHESSRSCAHMCCHVYPTDLNRFGGLRIRPLRARVQSLSCPLLAPSGVPAVENIAIAPQARDIYDLRIQGRCGRRSDGGGAAGSPSACVASCGSAATSLHGATVAPGNPLRPRGLAAFGAPRGRAKSRACCSDVQAAPLGTAHTSYCATILQETRRARLLERFVENKA